MSNFLTVKKIPFVLVFFIFLLLFYSLGRQIYDSLQAGVRFDKSVEELTLLQKENAELKKKMAQVSSPEFIEQQARDKMNLSRNGESVVIISADEMEKVLAVHTEIPKIVIPNWQGWLNLFLH